MKSVFFIPILFILFLQSLHVSLEDIVKVPELIEHYQEHKVNEGDGILAFIKKHYGSQKKTHESQESEHEDLPFHNSHHFCIDLKVDVPTDLTFNSIEPNQSKHYFVYKAPYTASATHSLFQPPQNNC